jgi:hypothetical protein
MTPKLTDDAISRLPLEAGRAELLEEIMSTVAPDRQNTEPTPHPASRRTRWLVPLAVAAAVATVASSPLWWGGGGPGNDGNPKVSYHAASDSPGTGYRAVLTAPGWTVDHTEADSQYGGEVGYTKGEQRLDITWYPEKTYQDYLTDREYISYPDRSPGDPVEVLGVAGHLWAYADNDHTVMREPDQGHWMEFRGAGMDRASFEELLTHLRLVSLPEFESALPSSFVTSDDRPAAVKKILDGIEGVTGVTVPAGTTLDTRSDDQDPYQLGADIAGQYACAWIADFADAKAAGDQARADEAVRVMGTSRQWPILVEMEKTGEYSDVVWEYADGMAAGKVPEGYDEGLGCDAAVAVPSSQPS